MAHLPLSACIPCAAPPTHSAPDTTIIRRRLAPNVVCMFIDDRPVVVNMPRRGRFPLGVISIRSRERFAVGDLAELISSEFPENVGKPVRILPFGKPTGTILTQGGWLRIECLSGSLAGRDIDTREVGLYPTYECYVRPTQLRRVWTGNR